MKDKERAKIYADFGENFLYSLWDHNDGDVNKTFADAVEGLVVNLSIMLKTFASKMSKEEAQELIEEVIMSLQKLTAAESKAQARE